jgi:hypothetical protein
MAGAAQVEPPSRPEVLRALGRGDLAGDGTVKLQVRPWKAMAGAFVALLYVDAGEVVRATRVPPTLAVLTSLGGKLSIVAQAAIDDQRCRELPDAGDFGSNQGGDDCEDMRLDLAPYRISASETALGLRTTIRSVFGAGESEAEYLTLFAISGDRRDALRPIFSHAMSVSDVQRGPGDMTTLETTLRVSDHLTAGHFDLLLAESSRRDKIGGSSGATVKRVEHRFLWQGEGYVAAQP